ncbi:MAG TPA: hypothetical protein VN679_15170 [Candidatus Acidoferrales bacterium]|nr:hypothetical protein [Candidatus Acidoferrales bacterium]
MNTKHLSRRVENGLAELLSHFGRSIGRFDVSYDVVRDCMRLRAIINLPWGEQTQVNAEVWTLELTSHDADGIINKIVLELFRRAVDEADIKEEVANESLPPEVLDIFERITHVANTMVVQ